MAGIGSTLHEDRPGGPEVLEEFEQAAVRELQIRGMNHRTRYPCQGLHLRAGND
jgi:hypothetical protein